MSSYSLDVSRIYAHFFWKCAEFALSPYIMMFNVIAAPDENGGEENVAAAAVIVGLLTFVVPVLPMLASFTIPLASIAMSLAIASMFIVYPIALIFDVCSGLSPSSKDNCLVMDLGRLGPRF